jgi:flagellar FliJ protein
MKWANSLIRISNHQVETLQKRLAVLVEARMAAEMKLVMLHAEAEAEAAHVDQDAHAGFYRITFLKGWRFRRDQAIADIAAAQAEEEGARDALSRAFEQLKKFEQVAEMARVTELKEAARKETAALDELGIRAVRGR